MKSVLTLHVFDEDKKKIYEHLSEYGKEGKMPCALFHDMIVAFEEKENLKTDPV